MHNAASQSASLPVLEEDTHTYFLNGKVIPGVTTMISDAKLVDLDQIPPAVLEHKRNIGNAVHYATELHDLGVLDPASVHESIKPYFNAYLKFLAETDVQILEVENVVYHDTYQYAGKNDRVILLNGYRGVLDIKTTSILSAAVGVQTAAYKEALNCGRADADKVVTRFALQLRPDSTYRLEQFSDHSDFSTFLACLQVYNWKQKHLKK